MPHQPENFRELIEVGGPIMWPLLGVSVVAGAVVVERAVHYSSQGLSFDRFVDRLTGAIRQGDLDTARKESAKKRSPIAKLATVFVDEIGRSKATRTDILQREGGFLVEVVEKRLAILRLIVQVAPILGLLGTVHGLLLAFWDLELVEGPIRPSDVAGGIGSALTTTVFGLSIAIPCSAFLLMFEEHAERLARRMGFLVSHLEEALAEREQPPNEATIDPPAQEGAIAPAPGP